MEETSKWAGEDICLQYSDVPRGPASGGRRTAAGWEGELRKDDVYFWCLYWVWFAHLLGSSDGLWMQKFLQTRKWTFYVGVWGKGVGRKACKGICFLGYREFSRHGPTAGGWGQKVLWWDYKEVFPYSRWMMCPVPPLKMILHVFQCFSWLKGSSACQASNGRTLGGDFLFPHPLQSFCSEQAK